MNTAFRIVNRHRDAIRCNLHLPPETAGAPIVLLCHGFKGFKDWGLFPYAAEHFALKGFVAIRFDFSLNGVEEVDGEFTALERFARNTVGRELDDLDDLVNAVMEGDVVPDDCDRGRIMLVGHSLGGGVAIVHAAEDPRIAAVATWAGVADFMRWGKKTRAAWRKTGRLEIENTRTGQKMPMDVVMLDDLEANVARYDILAAAARLARPLLVLHGEQDVSVPLDEGRRIIAAADSSLSRMHVLPNTDHTFGARHPFEGSTTALKTVLTESIRHFRNV
ncbi:MAG: alpha/beta fold hydrolase [Bacteroidetes bacterium]|nr:alpha/beta fold hydrolase [Bacteroidota bacterium]